MGCNRVAVGHRAFVVAAFSALVLSAVLQPSPASAFTEPRTYYADSQDGGGGGRFFTGSPAEGFSCSVCHTGPEPDPIRVRGLPENGYVPGGIYDIRISWPGFQKRAEEVREAGGEPPRASLTAELVAETGEASGSIEIAVPNNAEEGELCVVPENTQAAQLYQVRPLEDVVEQTFRCDSLALGQRCVLGMLACGSSELHFRWTAPDQWQDAIWLSVGWVGTEEVSGDAGGDEVFEFSRPILPAASQSEQYAATLDGGCRLASAGHGRAGSAGWIVVALIGLRRSRNRSHRRGR